MHVCVCIHMCVHVYVYIVLCTCVHACVHVCACARLHTHVHVCRSWLAWVEGADVQFGFVSAPAQCSRCRQSGTISNP